MTWFKVDDKLWGHPKWMSLPAGARALWVTAGSYCASNETGGRLPASMIPVLGGRQRDADALVAAGLWHPAEPDPRHNRATSQPESRQTSAKSPPSSGLANSTARSRSGGTRQRVHVYLFHDWEKYQPTKSQLEARREASAERQRRSRERAKERQTSRRDSHVTNGVSHTPVTEPRPDPTRPDPLSYGESTALARSDARAPDRIPHDWTPTPEHHAYATTHGIDLDRQAFRFRNHATTTGRTVANWNTAFTLWLDTERDRTPAPRPGHDTDPWAHLPDASAPRFDGDDPA